MEDFDTFYAATSERVLAQVHAFTGDLAEAQDCVQEAYARAWQRWHTVREYDAPNAWVRRVACRLAVSRFRHTRAGIGVLRRQGPPTVVPDLDPSHVALISALRKVPADQRLALVLHHVADLSLEDVALETGVPVGTVKSRLSRGRAALAALLSDDAEGATRAS